MVAAIGMALNFSRFWIGLTPVVLSVGGLTLLLTVLAVLRRRSVPPSKRFAVPFQEWLRSARSSPFGTGSRSELALNVVLAVSVLVAASGVVYALATPRQGAAHTEMYLLTENESGDLVADGYPQEFTTGEEEPFYLGISNHEHETVQYTVVVQLQRTDPGAGELQVVERNELGRFDVTLVDGETWRDRRVFQPQTTGNNLRLTYLLYRGEAPETATRANAYRTVDLKIDVSE